MFWIFIFGELRDVEQLYFTVLDFRNTAFIL